MGITMHQSTAISDYFDCSYRVLNNPVISRFLSSKKNVALILQAKEEESIECKRKLDQAFRDHFYKVRIINYVANVIHYYTIEIKNRYERFHKRNVSILDEEASSDNEESMPLMDLLTESDTHKPEEVLETSLIASIEDENLHGALSTLPAKQMKVLEMIYVEGKENKEAAKYFGQSEQNISKLHKRALLSLKEQLWGQPNETQ
ncbi:sigma-70 family RNA polymerase sigma factor [Lentibacillus sediminis]|uniref:sigma-70 family RNA polymerase sigma factor n=1 Tax=Lentibacillus sediminis TaxID=1940529 RepID=UPI000C1C47D1|nr:sigma-70 family RNA polymerase sigma factor [Lentibacillus sediminis]